MSDHRHVSCWADGPVREVWVGPDGRVVESVDELPDDESVIFWWAGWKQIGSTCLLPHGHAGEHEFTPDDEIRIKFAP